MDIQTLKKHTIDTIIKYPSLSYDVKDMYELAITEIEEGGSERTECDRAIDAIDEIVNEYEMQLKHKFQS